MTRRSAASSRQAPAARHRSLSGWVMAGVLAAAPAVGQVPVDVPSGQPVELVEVLLDENPGALWVRFRFLAPRIAENGGDVSYEIAGPDMDHLCDAVAVPYLEAHDIDAVRVVISLADRAVEFGASDPDATQFFETYRVEDGACIWEEF